jgi:endogenous inhibitor of DNA gyrase (YacG/DUF329 family)
MERLCPICKRKIPADSGRQPYHPFCSPRCKLADLGSWLSGSYRISRPLSEEDLDEGVPPGVGTGSDEDGKN